MCVCKRFQSSAKIYVDSREPSHVCLCVCASMCGAANWFKCSKVFLCVRSFTPPTIRPNMVGDCCTKCSMVAERVVLVMARVLRSKKRDAHTRTLCKHSGPEIDVVVAVVCPGNTGDRVRKTRWQHKRTHTHGRKYCWICPCNPYGSIGARASDHSPATLSQSVTTLLWSGHRISTCPQRVCVLLIVAAAVETELICS